MKIELRPAYLFDCPDCGAENLIRIMLIDGTPDEETAQAREAMDIPEDSPIPTYPRDFTCKSCGMHLDLGGTIGPGEEEDNEDEEDEEDDTQ
jgi:hypothetical protein